MATKPPELASYDSVCEVMYAALRAVRDTSTAIPVVEGYIASIDMARLSREQVVAVETMRTTCAILTEALVRIVTLAGIAGVEGMVAS